MDISSLTGVTGSVQSQNIQRTSDKLQAVIASIVSGTQVSDSGDNVVNVSIASQLQSSLASLRSLSGSLAFAGSLSQVADGGVAQIQSVLQNLQSLAEQASGTTSDTDSASLNQQFQALAAQIDQIAGGTSFNGKALLNGSLSGDDALSLDDDAAEGENDSLSLSLSDMTTNGLFGSLPNLLSASSASEALGDIHNAINQVATNGAAIAAFGQSVDYASATVDTAVNNQQAAMSSLQDSDLADASTQLSQASVQQDAGGALTAQGSQLLPSLLNLLES